MRFSPPSDGDAGYWGTVVTYRDARQRLFKRGRSTQARQTQVLETAIESSIRTYFDDAQREIEELFE